MCLPISWKGQRYRTCVSVGGAGEHKRKNGSAPGIELGTSSTQRRNHTSRPCRPAQIIDHTVYDTYTSIHYSLILPPVPPPFQIIFINNKYILNTNYSINKN